MTMKYVFSLALIFVAFVRIDSKRYMLAQFLELLIICILSNILMNRKRIGQIVNNVLLLLFNAQMMVLIFGNTYVSMIMITNLDSIEALAGKAGIYIMGVLLVLVFSFLPIQQIIFEKCNWQSLLSFVLCLELGFTMLFGNTQSPLYGYVDLAIQMYQTAQYTKTIQETASNAVNSETGERTITDFYRDSLGDYRTKTSDLSEQPNVILIFTEGLSQNIIDDERGIMPNVAQYQQKTLNFTNYYNHTFATYRGLIGQLYSGYQLENFDTNALISLQSILGDQGYNTFWINTEPNNAEFTSYLESFAFDQLVGDPSFACNGKSDTMTDKEAYEVLYETVEQQAASGEPYFLGMYTFGTHVSLDSPDEKFGDGQDAELNKFYNLDYQFGKFMEKFVNSPVSENTILIFTTDHATYNDDSFMAAFPDYKRDQAALDKIPLFFYYDEIQPETIDVDGRNTICLAATILDYLDISAPNYFIGSSLFSGQFGSVCEHSHTDSFNVITTKHGAFGYLDEASLQQFNTVVQDYYITKTVASNK